MKFDLKDLMADYTSSIIVNNDLAKRLDLYKKNWETKNDEQMDFLSSNTLGTYRIVYTASDEEKFFSTIILCDPNKLGKAIKKLPSTNPNWFTVNNPQYVACMYLAHIFINSDLKNEVKYKAAKDACCLFEYKAASSMINHYFKYTNTPELGQAVAERLSNKFILKQKGNWYNLFDYKSNDVIPNGTQYERIKRFSTEDVQWAISAMYSNIKDIIKNIYAKIIEVQEDQSKILTSSNVGKVGEDDSSEGYKDVTSTVTSILQESLNSVNSLSDFYIEDLLMLILTKYGDNNHLIGEESVKSIPSINRKDLNKIVTVAVTSCVNYLASIGIYNDFRRNIYTVIEKSKFFFTTKLIRDKELDKVKNYLSKLVIKKYGRLNSSIINSAVTIMLVYIVCRGMYKK